MTDGPESYIGYRLKPLDANPEQNPSPAIDDAAPSGQAGNSRLAAMEPGEYAAIVRQRVALSVEHNATDEPKRDEVGLSTYHRFLIDNQL